MPISLECVKGKSKLNFSKQISLENKKSLGRFTITSWGGERYRRPKMRQRERAWVPLINLQYNSVVVIYFNQKEFVYHSKWDMWISLKFGGGGDTFSLFLFFTNDKSLLFFILLYFMSKLQ